MSVALSLLNIGISFAVLVITPAFAQVTTCTVASFGISPYAGSFEYAANFTTFGSCEASQFIVTELYLEGDCIKNRNDNSGADCSQQNGTATATSCNLVFSVANDDNFVEMTTIDDSTLTFDSGTVCGSNASAAYIYINTTCTSFNTSWIQLNPVEDPVDCQTIKAYNYGAAIGIIVAVVVVLALLIGGWIYWYRRSRSRQGVYETHHDIHMQPYPEDSAGQAYNEQGYSSSSLPAQQTSSNDRVHPGYPAAGQGNTVQGPPVYPPWTGGGFKPPGNSTPR